MDSKSKLTVKELVFTWTSGMMTMRGNSGY